MNIYAKIQKARVELQSRPLKKTGKNTFAKYEYFELEDFLPSVQSIFNDVGLCGVVSFATDTATLSIHDTDSECCVSFRAPMSSADLKGCHDVQNLGAVISYMRRYLWMLALEIVEHDALDATTGKKETQTDYTALLRESVDLHSLILRWQSIPKAKQKQYVQIKDEMKAILSKGVVNENIVRAQ